MKLIAVLLFMAGATLILLASLKKDTTEQFEHRPRTLSYTEKLGRRLRTAGYSALSPILFLLMALGLGLFVGLVLLLFTNSLFLALFLMLTTMGMPFFWLSMREKSTSKRATADLVRVLENLKAYVIVGDSAETAFLKAIDKSRFLKYLFERPIVSMRQGQPFVEVLKSTTEILPIKRWEQFVRQLEINYNLGGEAFEQTISSSVEQINRELRQEASMRTEYQSISRQAYTIIGVTVLMPLMLELLMGGMITDMLRSGIDGWFILGIVAALDGLSLFLIRKLVKQFEAKVES